VKNLQLTLTGDYLAAPSVNDPLSTTATKATIPNGVTTLAGFVGYAEPESFSVGAEGFLATRANGQVDPSGTNGARTKLSAFGLSFFGWWNFNPTLAVVGRFDIFDPNNNSGVTGDARNYIIASLVYRPVKNVSIMPNVQIETYQSVPLPNSQSLSIDASVTGRVTFYYVFL
jgi:hypothetical protein